jgi:hypothetical protein
MMKRDSRMVIAVLVGAVALLLLPLGCDTGTGVGTPPPPDTLVGTVAVGKTAGVIAMSLPPPVAAKGEKIEVTGELRLPDESADGWADLVILGTYEDKGPGKDPVVIAKAEGDMEIGGKTKKVKLHIDGTYTEADGLVAVVTFEGDDVTGAVSAVAIAADLYLGSYGPDEDTPDEWGTFNMAITKNGLWGTWSSPDGRYYGYINGKLTYAKEYYEALDAIKKAEEELEKIEKIKEIEKTLILKEEKDLGLKIRIYEDGEDIGYALGILSRKTQDVKGFFDDKYDFGYWKGALADPPAFLEGL